MHPTHFAGQWALAGGSIEKLREVLGHSTIMVTERHAHLRPDSFPASDLSRVSVDLSAATGRVIPFAGGHRAQSIAAGYAVVTTDTEREAKKATNA